MREAKHFEEQSLRDEDGWEVGGMLSIVLCPKPSPSDFRIRKFTFDRGHSIQQIARHETYVQLRTHLHPRALS